MGYAWFMINMNPLDPGFRLPFGGLESFWTWAEEVNFGVVLPEVSLHTETPKDLRHRFESYMKGMAKLYNYRIQHCQGNGLCIDCLQPGYPYCPQHEQDSINEA